MSIYKLSVRFTNQMFSPWANLTTSFSSSRMFMLSFSSSSVPFRSSTRGALKGEKSRPCYCALWLSTLLTRWKRSLVILFAICILVYFIFSVRLSISVYCTGETDLYMYILLTSFSRRFSRPFRSLWLRVFILKQRYFMD
jgi:hypothetical protein